MFQSVVPRQTLFFPMVEVKAGMTTRARRDTEARLRIMDGQLN